MTVLLKKRTFLVSLLMRQSIVAGVNSILGMYCKGTVDKKGDTIFFGGGTMMKQSSNPVMTSSAGGAKDCLDQQSV